MGWASRPSVFNPDVGESCSICRASATKGGHDPPVIILFRRYDGRIPRILEQEHEHEQEDELSTSVLGFNGRDTQPAPAMAILASGANIT